jgi:CubicO group peptidase (beta-lactamase class C family)
MGAVQAQPKYASIDNSMREFMSEKKIPRFVACIVKDSAVRWSNSYGQADIRNNIPMSLDAMNIGSISKTFTATAAMQLWEKGLLQLDVDINRYLDFEIRNPKYPDNPITADGKAYHHSYSCGDPTQSLNDWIRSSLSPNGTYYYQGSNFGDWSPGD